MLDITWKVFSQTGNIETYLLLKELENVDNQVQNATEKYEDETIGDRETTQKLY